jgi:AcrR family transcriptional regulator
MATTTPAKSRKKNVRRSREDRVASILAAARGVFEERGYEAATVAEIAERVDVVEGTVLHYFSSKRALVLGVMEQFYDEITATVGERLPGIRGLRNQLHFIIWNHLRVLRENSALCAVILRESRSIDQALTREVHDKNRLYTQVVRDIVQAGIESGEFRPQASPALVRNMIFGATEHFLWDRVTGGVDFDSEALAGQLTELIYSGIVAQPGEADRATINQLIARLNGLLAG